MNEINFLSLLNEHTPKLRKTIKEIYNLKNDVKIFNWDEIKVTIKYFDKIKKLAERKNNGDDITFEVGYRYFRNNKIELNRGVFVPQFDTEQIIDLVLEKGIQKGEALEVGSGSGAIAISLKNETKLNITSLDINPLSISLSRKNDSSKKIFFLLEDYFKYTTNKKYDLLISNPPYIDKNSNEVEEWVKENQPAEALFSKENGFQFYKSFFERAPELLKTKAYIIVEIGYSQANHIVKLANKISKKVEVKKDYNGFDRFVVVYYEQ
ncbi:MAG: HemK family protein methyltransferase [Mycoplasmataceae bacterium]|nr:HemK family protein methyltransferase [Mycoplasmataceae bacterium]